MKAAANGGGGGGSHRSFLLSFPRFTFPKHLPFHLLPPSRDLRPPPLYFTPFYGGSGRSHRPSSPCQPLLSPDLHSLSLRRRFRFSGEVAAANGGKDVKLRFFLCFSSYAFILVDFLHFPSHLLVFLRTTHTSGRFPANNAAADDGWSRVLVLELR